MSQVIVRPPLSDSDVESLKAGTSVLITGIMYTARDAAHKRLIELIDKGEPLPFDLVGQILYYVGPTPARPGQVIGSAGPTTSYRVDSYTPRVLSLGLKATVGKGARGEAVVEAMRKYKAVYFHAVGGAAALISKSIKKSDIVGFEDLGTECIRKLEVESFPCVVAQDCFGESMYRLGLERYRVSL